MKNFKHNLAYNMQVITNKIYIFDEITSDTVTILLKAVVLITSQIN